LTDSFEKTPVKPGQNEVKSSTNNERFILFLHYGVAILCAKMVDKPHFDI